MRTRRSLKKASPQTGTLEVGPESQVEPAQLPQSSTPDHNAGSASAHAELAITPLEYLLAVMRDPAVKLERRYGMEKLALPYMHPKVSTGEPAGQGHASPDASEVSATDIARRIAFALATVAQADRE